MVLACGVASSRDPAETLAAIGCRRASAESSLTGALSFLVGAVMILIALGVFLTQGNQIRVTATVLSEHCHYQPDLGAPSATPTRCDASVRYADQSVSRALVRQRVARPSNSQPCLEDRCRNAVLLARHRGSSAASAMIKGRHQTGSRDGRYQRSLGS
jgi:hypothetical protein